eukprot:644440_1
MSTRFKHFTHHLQRISTRFASTKKSKTIDKQSAALVSLIETQQTQSVDSFIDANGPIKNIQDAYKIQQNVSKILESEYGDKYEPFGYKVGLTASNVRSIWNMSEPVVSPFYNIFHGGNNRTVEKPQGLTIAIEAEFVFRIGETLNIESMDAVALDDVYPLIDCVYPGFELVDPHIIENESLFKVPIEYLISDLCWSGGLVIGSESRLRDLNCFSWKEYDDKELKDAAVELYVNNDQKGIGYGREVYDSPFNALLFVYNHLLKQAKTVKEGQYVTTGSVTGVTFVEKNDIAEGVFENIGDVELKLV